MHPSPVDTISYALRLAAGQTPSRLARVIVIGDRPVIDLASASAGVFDGEAIRGAPYAMNNCDIVPGRIIDENGREEVRPSKCDRLAHNIRQVSNAFSPTYGVLMLGPTDARDRVVRGKPIRFRSEEQRALVYAAVDQARRAVRATGARFILLPVRCDRSTTVPGARVDWLNQVLADYARTRSDVDFKGKAVSQCESGTARSAWTWPELEQLITSD